MKLSLTTPLMNLPKYNTAMVHKVKGQHWSQWTAFSQAVSGRRVRARWHPVPLISRNPAISDVTNTPWHWVDEIRHSKSPKALHGQSSYRAVHQRHRRLFFIPTWIWTLFVIRQWHARPADYGCNLVMALISHFLSILTLLILLQSTNGKMLLHPVQSQTVKCLKHYNGFCYWWWRTTQATDYINLAMIGQIILLNKGVNQQTLHNKVCVSKKLRNRI